MGGCEGVDHDLLFPNPISEPNIQALKVFFQTGETLLKEWPSVVLVNYLGLLLVKCQELLLNFCFFLQDIRSPHLLVNFFQPFYPGWKYLLVQLKLLHTRGSATLLLTIAVNLLLGPALLHPNSGIEGKIQDQIQFWPSHSYVWASARWWWDH